MVSGELKFMENLGELLIGGALATIGWLLSTFTKRHLESMDKLTTNVAALRESVVRLEARVANLETKE